MDGLARITGQAAGLSKSGPSGSTPTAGAWEASPASCRLRARARRSWACGSKAVSSDRASPRQRGLREAAQPVMHD